VPKLSPPAPGKPFRSMQEMIEWARGKWDPNRSYCDCCGCGCECWGECDEA